MHKVWVKPELEVLEVSKTMEGWPDQIIDKIDVNGSETLSGPS